VNPTLVTTTEAVDKAFYVIVGISAVFLVGIFITMLWFLWRYNRKREPVPLSQKDQNIPLEIVWTVVPTLLVIVMFWYGWEGYLSLRNIPENAMPVKASARMWSWLFTYENGKTAGKLYVPVGQPVKVELTAEDVLHSFYVPAFRVKRDTVPGMTNYVWFVAEEPGSYNLFCAEYCGVGHADMITTVEAMPTDEFQNWLAAEPTAGDAGRDLLQKHGCLGCHSLDGSKGVGPTLQGIANRQVTVMTNDQQRTLTSDRDYLKTSILNPNDDVVQGYPPAMPSYEGKIPEEELNGILDYLMSGPAAASQAAPEQEQAETEQQPAPTEGAPSETAAAAEEPDDHDLLQELGCLACHSLDGSPSVGPTLQNIANRQITVIKDGQEQTLQSDRDYLKAAILHPNQEVVKGYPAAMPPYQGRISEEQLEQVLDFLMAASNAQATSDTTKQADPAPKKSAAGKEPATPKKQPEKMPAATPQTKTDQQPVPAETGEDLIAKGEKLANQNGCLGCHSLDGSRKVGPTLQGLFGSQSTIVRDGEERTVTVNAAYLERALRHPNADVVKGFPPVMPPSDNLSDADIKALIAWMESL